MGMGTMVRGQREGSISKINFHIAIDEKIGCNNRILIWVITQIIRKLFKKKCTICSHLISKILVSNKLHSTFFKDNIAQ